MVGPVPQWPVPPAADVQSLSLWCRQTGDLLTQRFAGLESSSQVVVSLDGFGATGDGVTDDYAAVQAAFDYAAANGVLLYAPPGTYLLSARVLVDPATTAFGLIGAGPDLTIFRKTTADVATVMEFRNCDGLRLGGFTIDGQFATLAEGNQGLVIRNVDNAFVKRVRIEDYKQVGILVFATVSSADNTPLPDTYSNVVIEDCETIGGALGIMIADYMDSGMRGCISTGATGDPGYAMQLKNKCVRCWMHDCQAYDSDTGLSFTGETGLGMILCRVSNCTVSGCGRGINVGQDTENNHFSDILIDMQGAGTDAIVLQTNVDTNLFEGITAVNIAATEFAVVFVAGASNNRVHFNYIDQPSGNLVLFSAGCANNDVHIDKTADNSPPTVLDNSGNDSNLVTYRGNLLSRTVQATASGTAFDFTIPTWARRVTVLFDQVSLSGAENLLVQIGDSGGVETTGYNAGSNTATTNDGFIVEVANAARLAMGIMTICDTGDNVWVASHAVGFTAGGGFTATGGGRKQLSATLDRVRITRTGADTFDGGRVNVLFE